MSPGLGRSPSLSVGLCSPSFIGFLLRLQVEAKWCQQLSESRTTKGIIRLIPRSPSLSLAQLGPLASGGILRVNARQNLSAVYQRAAALSAHVPPASESPGSTWQYAAFWAQAPLLAGGLWGPEKESVWSQGWFRTETVPIPKPKEGRGENKGQETCPALTPLVPKYFLFGFHH